MLRVLESKSDSYCNGKKMRRWTIIRNIGPPVAKGVELTKEMEPYMGGLSSKFKPLREILQIHTLIFPH